MKQVIWKHHLKFRSVGSSYTLMLPDECEILDVQMQNNQFIAWEIHDIANNYRSIFRTFRLSNTGDEYITNKPQKHIATVQADGFVWHIFEELGQ